MTLRAFSDLVPGERIVVRYRHPEAGPGPRLTDALGTFTALETEDDGAVVVIETRHGTVRVPVASVTHAKRVPPPPPRRRPRQG
ncbi:hypothetical protein GCM10027591_14740 [Zhihengliuella somnathii]